MLNGYTLLGCVDEGEVSDFSGLPKYSFYLTHSDDAIRADLMENASLLRDEYQTSPHGYREYFLHLKLLTKKTRNPIRKEDFEQ